MNAKFGINGWGDLYAEMDGKRQVVIGQGKGFGTDEEYAAQRSFLRMVADRLNTFDTFPNDEAIAIFGNAKRIIAQQQNNVRFLEQVRFPETI